MQIIRSGKVSRLHDLLAIREKTFANNKIMQLRKIPFEMMNRVNCAMFCSISPNSSLLLTCQLQIWLTLTACTGNNSSNSVPFWLLQ